MHYSPVSIFPPATTYFTVPYSKGMSSSPTTTMGKLLMAHHTSRAARLSPERYLSPPSPPLQKNEKKTTLSSGPKIKEKLLVFEGVYTIVFENVFRKITYLK